MALLSLVLTLRPRVAQPLPPMLGRAAHAVLLRAVSEARPDLAGLLAGGDGDVVRPFTCSSLLGPLRNGAVQPDLSYVLRYTSLAPDLGALLPGLFKTGTNIEFGGIQFAVVAIASDPAAQVWAARMTFEQISARWLDSQAVPDAVVGLQLASPVAFNLGGKAQLFPLPELVFGGLLDKWNAFAPVALADDTRRHIAESVAASRLELSTRPVPFKSDSVFKFGTVGTVVYTILDRDRRWLSTINLLADFAQFAGIGTGTAWGMGQARRIADPAARQ